MRTILVDDERKGIEVLEYQLKKCFPELEIVGKATNLDEAEKLIEREKPFVLFLDVSMSEGTSFRLFEKTDLSNVEVVFVTAHTKYAVEAFKVDAFDYILKPVIMEELERVVSKLKIRFDEVSNQSGAKKNLIRIKISNTHKLVSSSDVVNISSEGNYSTIFFSNQKSLMITKNLKKVQEQYFNEFPFVRIHQSHIVNVNHVKEFDRSHAILSNDQRLKISKSRHAHFSNTMNTL